MKTIAIKLISYVFDTVGTQQMPSTSNEYINDSTEIDFNNK